MPLPHLDRFFDYAIPTSMAGQAVPGARVRVRFAGRLCNGFIVVITDQTEVEGRLAPVSKVISPEPVLLDAQVRLIRAVADHYAGTFADVVRLAVPPRHAATEAATQREWPRPDAGRMPGGGLLAQPGGEAFLTRLARGEPVRGAWQVIPRHLADADGRDDWTRGFVQAAVATLRSGRGVAIVVPDARDIARVRDALAPVIGLGTIAELHSQLGTAARYRNYLAISRGQAHVVVGTRPAVYAPVAHLGLVCLWDDGDDLHSDPRAPYPHARDVAALRAMGEPAGLLLAHHGRTAEVQAWVSRGWLGGIGMPPAEARHHSPAIRVAGDSDVALERDPLARAARLPSLAFQTIRTGLTQGPVLVQVPRAGYLPALTCQTCRTPVRCPVCHGPVRARRAPAGPGADRGRRQLDCTWCGRIVSDWTCPVCGGAELRAPVVGSQRTAEELGRAFPGVRVQESSGDRVLDTVGDQPALVVATPGAEPLAGHGYAAAVLLDAGRLLERPDLRASEEALRRWLNAVSLVRPGAAGGTVCVVGPAGARAVQALVRLDPAGHADRELADRAEAGFPPAVRFVTVEGSARALGELVDLMDEVPDAERLGPVELPGPPAVGQTEPLWQLTVRAPLLRGSELVRAVKAVVAIRSARKLEGAVRVRVDPARL